MDVRTLADLEQLVWYVICDCGAEEGLAECAKEKAGGLG